MHLQYIYLYILTLRVILIYNRLQVNCIYNSPVRRLVSHFTIKAVITFLLAKKITIPKFMTQFTMAKLYKIIEKSFPFNSVLLQSQNLYSMWKLSGVVFPPPLGSKRQHVSARKLLQWCCQGNVIEEAVFDVWGYYGIYKLKYQFSASWLIHVCGQRLYSNVNTILLYNNYWHIYIYIYIYIIIHRQICFFLSELIIYISLRKNKNRSH